MVVVYCKIILSAPVLVPFPWTLDFGFGTWSWDFGLGLGLDNLYGNQWNRQIKQNKLLNYIKIWSFIGSEEEEEEDRVDGRAPIYFAAGLFMLVLR